MANQAVVQRTRDQATEIRDTGGKWLGTFTPGAYTVLLAGPRRSFSEGEASVSHAKWVRAYPRPFAGTVDGQWLQRALAANQARVPDVLAIAMQYIRGAPAKHEGGLQIAGDAHYGPKGPDGKRLERSDFNDYLGITWTYPDEPPDPPEAKRLHCLDCSGYMRMIWGFRHHLPGAGYRDQVPLSRSSRLDRTTIPRRSFQIFKSAPGIVVLPRGTAPPDPSRLQIGDLVFFDADPDDGPRIDHLGMYLGRDLDGRHRFISSRKTRNGPTLADTGGPSLLDGTGLYARSFCAARRL